MVLTMTCVYIFLMGWTEFKEYCGQFLNFKYGELSRTEYLFGTLALTNLVALGAVFFIIFFVKEEMTDGITIFGHKHSAVVLGVEYALITLVNISAFLRRMNKVKLSKLYALVYFIPGIGHFTAFVIAMLPDGFGDVY